MKVIQVSIAKIKPAKYNPRVPLKAGDPEYEKLKRSLTEFGVVDPLIWNAHNGVLIGGHQRLQVLKDLGWKEAPCSVVTIKDPSKERALNVALNKIQGEFDEVLLSALFKELAEENYDSTITGFSELEIKALLDFEAQISIAGEPGTSPGDKLEGFQEGAIKQIVLYFAGTEYADIVARLDAVRQKEGVDTNTEAFLAMLSAHEKTHPRKATHPKKAA